MKHFILSLIIILLATGSFATVLKKGDSLQILYKRVWAYENPEDFSTRLGPYSYLKKMIFISESGEYPGYYQVITPDGKTALIKKHLLAGSPGITKKQVLNDISEGKREKNQYTKFHFLDRKKLGLSRWAMVGIYVLILALLLAIWFFFPRFDRWMLRLDGKNESNAQLPWFIKYAALLGIVIGGIMLFKPAETEWFLNEGLRLWANYPTFWDWILWGLCLLFAVDLIAGIVTPFFRFSLVFAILYAIIALVLMSLYFLAGIASGGLIVIIAIIIFIISILGGGGKSYDVVDSSTGQKVGTISGV